ncbi:MAG: hypothetical protein C4576_05735 [Desulfobacteraceae bacterium]|nr:MAG: hypothetical protein C4576_05735 [Desulfobacteraceae bacterium]
MKRRAVFMIIGVAVALGTALFIWPRAVKENPGEVQPINFGTVPAAATTLIYIAEDQGFFAANRLRVNVKDYSSGMATTEALLKGELDIAWVAEFPFVQRAIGREEISIIAVVGRFNDQILFGRKDRGIHTVADLKGKRIGLPRNTIADFYLGRFLELNGMNVRALALVDVHPAKSMEAVTGGEVDGVVVWQPYSSRLRAQLTGGATAFPLQSGQPGYGTLACRNDWIEIHRGAMKRFLASLARAEEYILRNPAGAKAVLRKRLNYDDVFTETIWTENQFSLFLDQSLITAMEDEARWMIKNGLTSEKAVPDFLKYIHEDGLKAVKSHGVSIIR